MASKKNGVPENHDGRVSVDRLEYVALKDLQNLHEGCAIERAKVTNRNHDLLVTCNAQAKRLTEADLAMQHLERINGLQRVYIEMLRGDHPKVASLEDLSTFWRHWSTTTENHLNQHPQQRDEVSKLEPDLFRSWKIWVRDSHKTRRTFAVAGTTRAEVEALNSIPQESLQDHIIANLSDKTTALTSRVRELEAEIDAYKKNQKRQG